jgi:DNA-binding FadR family transcriptional regulator
VQQVAEAIRAGDLLLGDRLPSERTLASQMEISRPTLREAVKVLSDAGVIEVRPGPSGGMFVRSDVIPKELVLERSQMLITEVSGVLEARRLFEPRVAQLAAVYATDEDFDEMRQLIEAQRAAVQTDESLRQQQMDVRFHLRIARSTRNATIVSLMRTLLRRLEIARDMALRGHRDPERAVEIHERTLRAIMSRDHEQIETAMDEHMSYLEDIWERESGRSRLREIPPFLLPRRES